MKHYYQSSLFPHIEEEQLQEIEKQILNEQKIVDYEVREYPVEVIVQKYVEGSENGQNEIFIPNYQRLFVWDAKQQSKFIESLMLGLPIPYIFTADNEGRMEVVDGSQRIRTLDAFLSNKLELRGLKKLSKLNGFRFAQLSQARQRKFNKKTIRIIDLTDKANYDVRKDMFERINTTPVVLSDMEIRKGVYEGAFRDFINECTRNIKFQLLCPIGRSRRDRDEAAEMVLRYFAYSENYESFEHSVKDFLNDFMQSKSKNFDAKTADKMRVNFEDMLDFVWINFPFGFKKSPSSGSTPRVRFEAISVGVNLALKAQRSLVPKPVAGWLESEEFLAHTKSDASNSRPKVKARVEFVRDKLLEK